MMASTTLCIVSCSRNLLFHKQYSERHKKRTFYSCSYFRQMFTKFFHLRLSSKCAIRCWLMTPATLQTCCHIPLWNLNVQKLIYLVNTVIKNLFWCSFTLHMLLAEFSGINSAKRELNILLSKLRETWSSRSTPEGMVVADRSAQRLKIMWLLWRSWHSARKVGHKPNIQHARYREKLVSHSPLLCASWSEVSKEAMHSHKSWAKPTAMYSSCKICGYWTIMNSI